MQSMLLLELSLSVACLLCVYDVVLVSQSFHAALRGFSVVALYVCLARASEHRCKRRGEAVAVRQCTRED